MRQVEIDILNFENKLLQDRRQLNDLIYLCRQEAASQDIILGKLQNIRQEMDYMESQIDMLNKVLQRDEAAPDNTVNVSVPQPDLRCEPDMDSENTPVFSVPQEKVISDETERNSENTPVFSMPQEQLRQTQPPAEKRDSKKRDLEKTFGRFWMGVIASGMVFISFIFFAVVLLPVLTDGMKIGAMFLVSFIFLGAGLVKLSVDNENKFYLALCGCGVGAVYISLLVSNIYFKAVNDIVLYLLLFVWAAGVCCLRRRETILFQLIGQIGITVAVSFGCRVCIQEPNAVKVLMLSMFYALSSMIFMTAHRQKKLTKNWISLVFNLVNLGQLLEMLAGMPDGFMIKAVSAMLFLYVALFFLFCYRCEATKDGLDFGILTVVCVDFTVCIFDVILQNVPSGPVIGGIAALAVCTLSMVMAERRLAVEASLGRVVIQIASMALMGYVVCDLKILDRHIYLALLMIPFLAAGFLKKNWYFRCGSLVYMVYFQFHMEMDNPEKMLWGFLYFGMLLYFMLREKEQYNVFFKLSAYVLFLIKLSADCVYIMSLFGEGTYAGVTLCCVVVGGINMAMSRLGRMGKNPLTGMIEPETKRTLNVIHVVQMCIIIVQILFPPGERAGMVTILWALILFMANTRKLLAEKKDTPAGFYIGMKFLVLLLSVLASFDISGVPVSICCFVLAVACIVAGFYVKCKSLRIYGLLLSMLSVFKLSLADIVLGGLLQLAAGFFVAGILCFVISRIYNMIDEELR